LTRSARASSLAARQASQKKKSFSKKVQEQANSCLLTEPEPNQSVSFSSELDNLGSQADYNSSSMDEA